MNGQDWQQIRKLHQSGMPVTAITRYLGISRNTVRRALEQDAPPALRQAASAPGGAVLPAELTEFIGRQEQLRAIRGLLGSARLVTLTGAGGTGKTRLAIQAADKVRRAFADGVRWVELGALRDPALLAQTLADSLGITGRGRTRPPGELLAEFLGPRQLLLVLDNCEHLLEACAELVSVFLHTAPQLRVIATSREALGLTGEQVVHVPPLPVPADDRADTSDSAVALFAARARDILPEFALTEDNLTLVRRVCAQLDGLPLAIELACVRLRALSVAELADRLDHRLGLLTSGSRGAPERHRSLQATLDWSFELCDPVERRLWTRTSVFAGGFARTAAEQVCGDGSLTADDILDGLDGLVGKSLLLREEHHGRVRFRMLETLREYGQSKLAPAEASELRDRHRAYYEAMIAQVTSEWFSARQQHWCTELRLEHANLRAAFEAALSTATATWDLIGSPWFLWAAGFSFAEHRYWLRRALDSGDEPSAGRARTLATFGLVATLQGDRESAARALAEGAALAELVGDRYALAYNRHEQGLVAFFGGDFGQSERILLDALDQYSLTDAPPDLVGSLRVHLGLLYLFAGDITAALGHFEQLRPQCEQRGEKWMQSYAVVGLGLASLMSGDADQAARHAADSLRMKQPFDDTIGQSLTIDLLAWAEAGRGRLERAALLLGAAETLWDSVGMQLYGSPHWLAQRDHFRQLAIRGLGEDAYDTALRRGQRLPADQLFRLAQNETDLADLAGPASSTGLTVPRPRPTPLSRRETEVAALVAQGLTNREIAQQLVISYRTVEGHVEHVLDKLGLERRTQIATWYTRAAVS